MPRRLQEVIERDRATTKYWYITDYIRNKDFTWIYLVSFVLNTFILASSHVFLRWLYNVHVCDTMLYVDYYWLLDKVLHDAVYIMKANKDF